MCKLYTQRPMKRAAASVLSSSAFARAASYFARDASPIFMLHRFRDIDAGNDGHDPRVLRAHLSWLRANKFQLISVTELIDRLAEEAPVRRAVAFTVDDGYADFARVGAPIFAEFDCPVTVFVTTGFLDGRHWMWWDKVSVAMAVLGREAIQIATIDAMKSMSESDRLGHIGGLIRESGVDFLSAPPARFAALSWDDVRRLSCSGVTFGPHSVTHPVLSRTGDEQSRREIAESWRRVRDEAGDAAAPLFCYPNGTRADFGIREEQFIANEGMRAALSTRAGYVSHRDFSVDRPSSRFRLRRFVCPEERSTFVQYASRVEWAKMFVRARLDRDP